MTNADIKASGLDLSRDNIFITNDRDNGGLINQFRRVQLLNLQVQVDDSAKTFARSSEGTKYKTSWTRAEKQRFRKVLGITGTDWVALSNRLSTKSPDQVSIPKACSLFFVEVSNTKVLLARKLLCVLLSREYSRH